MNRRRVVLNNWYAEMGYKRSDIAEQSPDGTDYPVAAESSARDISEEVAKAFGALTEDEHEVVVRYYLMGESLSQLSAISGRRRSALHGLLQRALRKMRRRLTSFVAARFELPQEEQPGCCLCDSLCRPEIDLLIKSRDRRQTWKPIIAILKARYGIRVTTPQMLIGHEKYHM